MNRYKLKKTIGITILTALILLVPVQITVNRLPLKIAEPQDLHTEQSITSESTAQGQATQSSTAPSVQVIPEQKLTLKATLWELGYRYRDSHINADYIKDVIEYNNSNRLNQILMYIKGFREITDLKTTYNKSNEEKDFDMAVANNSTEPTDEQVNYDWTTDEISYTEYKPGTKYKLLRGLVTTPTTASSNTDQTINKPNIHIVSEPQEPTWHITTKPTILGQARTPYSGEFKLNRNQNMKNAIDKINGTKLNPGEVFSMYEALQPFTEENGYSEAGVIKGNELTQAIGGGVCQVTTTLFNAVIRSELEVLESHNHSTKVGYISPGFDATVAGKYVDFKFKNVSDHPIYIFMYIDPTINTKLDSNNKYVRAIILGEDERPDNREIEFNTTYDEESNTYNLIKTAITHREDGTTEVIKTVIRSSKYNDQT